MPEFCFTGGVVSVRWLQFEAVVVARWFTAAISAARKKWQGGEKEEACGIIFFFVLLPVSLAAWSWLRTGEQDVGRFGVMHDLGSLVLTLIEKQPHNCSSIRRMFHDPRRNFGRVRNRFRRAALVGREEPNAPSAATAADTMNSEQERCRKRGDVNARFEVIELFLIGRTCGVRQLPDAAFIEKCFACSPYYRNLTVTWLEQVEVPWSHTIYTKLCLPVVPVESINLPVLGKPSRSECIAENVDAVCSRPGPGETRCIDSPHHFPTAGEHDVFSG